MHICAKYKCLCPYFIFHATTGKRRKIYFWLDPHQARRAEKHIIVSVEWLDCLGLNAGSKLLVGRGSRLGPAFIAGGPIYIEALKHNGVTEYR